MSRFLKVEKFNKVLVEKMEDDNQPDGNSSNGLDFLTVPCTNTENEKCPAGFRNSIMCVTPIDNMKLTNVCEVETPK